MADPPNVGEACGRQGRASGFDEMKALTLSQESRHSMKLHAPDDESVCAIHSAKGMPRGICVPSGHRDPLPKIGAFDSHSSYHWAIEGLLYFLGVWEKRLGKKTTSQGRSETAREV